MRAFIVAPLLASLTAWCAQASPFIHDISLGEHYAYAIALPAKNTDVLPPAILSLGGKGSQFQQGVTQTRNAVIQFGCGGWNVGRYHNGSTDAADVLAGEQFLHIIPYMYQYDTPDGEEPSYDTEYIHQVIQDAQKKYPFDPNRLHLAGYSMGARAAWPLIQGDSTLFASAAIISGTTYPDLDGLEDMIHVPLRQYAGTKDYEAVSQVYQHQAVQDRLVELGDTVSELITFDGYHVDGQQTAFDADLYTWFLQHTNDGTSASIAAALVANPSAQQQYSQDYASWSSWSSAHSYDLYAQGFASDSRPAAAAAASHSSTASVVTAAAERQSDQQPVLSIGADSSAQSFSFPFLSLIVSVTAATAIFSL